VKYVKYGKVSIAVTLIALYSNLCQIPFLLKRMRRSNNMFIVHNTITAENLNPNIFIGGHLPSTHATE
jgi:hypothetical protein